jgi:capsular exopolysaccharide synthesis family protein
MNTYVEIASSDISLDEVAEQLGLQEQPDVEIEIVPETELIRITASDPDPVKAQDIANALAQIIIRQNTELYGGSAPTVREVLEGQLEQAKIDLENALSEYDSALRVDQSEATRGANGTPMPNIESLVRLLSVRQQIYTDLLQKYESARTSEELHANAITVVEPATLPRDPATPKVSLNAALGLVAGFAAGVILTFLLEGMDDTLRGVEDVQTITSLPILSTVPELKRRLGSDGDLNLSQNGHHPIAQAFDRLCTRLILTDIESESMKLLITSPEPGVGKSTVAANLAVPLTEEGNQVLLIDMDFRRPRLHAILGLPNEKGLSNFMSGEIELDSALQKTTYPNLRVVTAGSSPHHKNERLAPVKTDVLLSMLGKECDYLLIDAPALLSVAEPIVLASQVDAVILVVARHETERENLRLALQQLNEINANVVGIVVNKVPYSRLFRYYSESQRKQFRFRQWKRFPFRQGEPKNRIVDAPDREPALDKR